MGLTTAAIASVGLLPAQDAQAADDRTPSVEEVQQKIGALYRKAGTGTPPRGAAQQAAAEERREVEELRSAYARRAERLRQTGRALGSSEEQHRAKPSAQAEEPNAPGGAPAEDDRRAPLEAAVDAQHGAIADRAVQRAVFAETPSEAGRPTSLPRSPSFLRTGKQQVQSKLIRARSVLWRGDAEARARFAAVEQEMAAEAWRITQEEARHTAMARAAAEEAELKRLERERQKHPGSPWGAALAEGVLAFVRAQLGKPYVRGATGPRSYDCSGLTRAAWRAAGVDLPRTAREQAYAGRQVDMGGLRPGDLVFFYDDSSHVGISIGGDRMIHAPQPGVDNHVEVREESIYMMPIRGIVRPA
ncbi:NlpC/P60 family protein [Streptomyces sp. NPDC056500]|uniref:NlpC/P60 family protein n=1 Tax=Streptomyces sp. NPDC056500 TaxID=3345840 RepID=UPI0036B434D1